MRRNLFSVIFIFAFWSLTSFAQSAGEIGRILNANSSYYEVLGVSPNATEAEIKVAHRKLLRTYHPDFYQNDPQKKAVAERITQKLNTTRDVLMNPTERRKYDMSRMSSQNRRTTSTNYDFKSSSNSAYANSRTSRGASSGAGSSQGGSEKSWYDRFRESTFKTKVDPEAGAKAKPYTFEDINVKPNPNQARPQAKTSTSSNSTSSTQRASASSSRAETRSSAGSTSSTSATGSTSSTSSGKSTSSASSNPSSAPKTEAPRETYTSRPNPPPQSPRSATSAEPKTPPRSTNYEHRRATQLYEDIQKNCSGGFYKSFIDEMI